MSIQYLAADEKRTRDWCDKLEKANAQIASLQKELAETQSLLVDAYTQVEKEHGRIAVLERLLRKGVALKWNLRGHLRGFCKWKADALAEFPELGKKGD